MKARKSRIFSYRPDGYGDLKEAVAALIDAAGGVRRSADKCRVGKSNLSDYANEHREDIHMPVDVVLQLEHASGVRAVSEHLAFEHGCVLVHLPKGGADPDWFSHMAAATQEFSDVVRAAGGFLDDGTLDEGEAMAWLREVDELLTEAASLREALKHHLGDDQAPAPVAHKAVQAAE